MPAETKSEPKRGRGRPKLYKPPALEMQFAALVVLTNTPAAAYKAIYPKATERNAKHRGALMLARPGVLDAVAKYRKLAVQRADSAADLTLAQSDAAMLRSCLDIAERADASAQDKAKAGATYATLRKALTGNGKDSPEDKTPPDLRSMLDAMKADRVKSGTPQATSPAD